MWCSNLMSPGREGEARPGDHIINSTTLHPEMVLGDWSRKDTLYGEGFSVIGNGELASQLREAILRLPAAPKPALAGVGGPEIVPLPASPVQDKTAPSSRRSFSEGGNVGEGSFFIGDDRRIRQVIDGQAEPVVYGGGQLWAGGALVGRRIGDLIGLRDRARTVLQSQNEGWPEEERNRARPS